MELAKNLTVRKREGELNSNYTVAIYVRFAQMPLKKSRTHFSQELRRAITNYCWYHVTLYNLWHIIWRGSEHIKPIAPKKKHE